MGAPKGRPAVGFEGGHREGQQSWPSRAVCAKGSPGSRTTLEEETNSSLLTKLLVAPPNQATETAPQAQTKLHDWF